MATNQIGPETHFLNVPNEMLPDLGRLAVLTGRIEHAAYEIANTLRLPRPGTGRTNPLPDASRIGREVEALYTNGPAGGGGATTSTREVLAMASTLIPRELVACQVSIEVA